MFGLGNHYSDVRSLKLATAHETSGHKARDNYKTTAQCTTFRSLVPERKVPFESRSYIRRPLSSAVYLLASAEDEDEERASEMRCPSGRLSFALSFLSCVLDHVSGIARVSEPVAIASDDSPVTGVNRSQRLVAGMS